MEKKLEVVIIAEKREINSSLNMYSEELDFSSLKVTTDIINALKLLDYKITYYTSPEIFIQNIAQHRDSIVFSNLWGGHHSRNKRSYLPAICEACNIRYVGADAYVQSLCQDKFLSKLYLKEYLFSIPRALLLSCENDINKVNNLAYYPCVVKPNDEGCSVGISDNSIVHSAGEAQETAHNLLKYYSPVLVEEFVGGREISICCAGKNNKLDILEAVELCIDDAPLNDRIWGYESKKMGSANVSRKIVTQDIPQWILDESVKLFNSLGKVDCMRIDGKLYNKRFYIIELSPDCSLHNNCFMANAFYHNGYTYAEMLNTLINYEL